MEQRRLRLGDILDDYCPRERRVTNHAVVAMIEEDVKQTRCTTCDAEHAYKGGREPRRRKKEPGAALYREVLADMPEPVNVAVSATTPVAADVPALETKPADEAVEPPRVAEPDAVETASAAGEEEPTVVDPVEEGPVHRPLIRATLPRPEGQKERQLPEFTVRHNSGRGGQFRGQQAAGRNGNGNGNRPPGRRFGGGNHPGMPGRGGSGRGAGGPFRGASNQQRQGGKKRSRYP